MIEASRAFVCIRPNTYESAAESRVLENFFRGRSGQLENTVFVLLDSDGKERLSRSHRTPQAVFGDAGGLAEAMVAIAKDYAASRDAALAIPVQPDLRHALNVAACDSVALLVLHGDDAKATATLSQRLAPALWAAGLPARVRCVEVVRGADPADAARVALAKGTGVTLVAPEPFGRTGTVLAHVAAAEDDGKLVAQIVAALDRHEPPAKLATPAHIRAGNAQGIRWETAIPVTDPGPRSGPPRRGREHGRDDGPPPPPRDHPGRDDG